MQVVEKRSKLIVIFILLFSVMVLLLLSNQNIEAAEAKIGLVNLTEVVSSHPYTEKISQTNLNLRNELQKRQEDLNKQGKGLDEVELKKLEDKFNKDWTPIKEKIIAELKSYQATRYSDVILAIKTIGEKGKYDLIINTEIKVPVASDVLSYPVALYGGEDITQDVIAEINRRLGEESKNKEAAAE